MKYNATPSISKATAEALDIWVVEHEDTLAALAYEHHRRAGRGFLVYDSRRESFAPGSNHKCVKLWYVSARDLGTKLTQSWLRLWGVPLDHAQREIEGYDPLRQLVLLWRFDPYAIRDHVRGELGPDAFDRRFFRAGTKLPSHVLKTFTPETSPVRAYLGTDEDIERAANLIRGLFGLGSDE